MRPKERAIMNHPAKFEKNLSRFTQLCPDSAESVKNADCSHLSFCKTEKGEDNLKNASWTAQPYFYNQNGAIEGLKEWLSDQLIIAEETILIYGVGLGYHYEIFKPWLKKIPKRLLIFIDDDPAVWHRFLEGSLAEEIMADSQVMLIDFKYPGYDHWNDFRSKFKWFITSSSLRLTKSFVLESYCINRKTETQLIMTQLTYLIEQARKFTKEMVVHPFMLFYNYFKNILTLPSNDTLTHNLKNKLKGLPFIVCGAGPSLAKVMPLLNDLRDKAVIFAAGTAMNIMTRRGVRPHFGASVDPMEIQESRILSSLAYEIPQVLIPRFYFAATPHLHGPLMFYNLFGGSSCCTWFDKELKLPHDRFAVGISTSTVACAMAAFFGTDLLILLGMDLAFIEGERYSTGVTIHPTTKPEPSKNPLLPGPKKLERHNIKGEVVNTHDLWLKESDFYKQYVGNYPHISLINCTDEGLKIDEVPTIPFDEVEKRRLTRSYDVQNWIHYAIQSSEPPKVTADEVLAALEKWKASLDVCRDFFTEKYKEAPLSSVEEEPAFKYSLKVLVEVYDEVTESEITKFDLYPHNFTEERKKEIREERELSRGKFLQPVIQEQLLAITNTIEDYRNTKRNELAKDLIKPVAYTSTDIYRYENGQIEIHDEELGIDFKESFTPTEIFKTLHKNGSIEKEMLYHGTELHGPSSFYNESGFLLARGWFIHGKRSGKSVQYYRTGDLYSIQRYLNGLPHGIQEYYYPNGQLKTKINYNNGAIEGELILYYPEGTMKKRQFFHDGLLNGIEEIWTPDGLLVVQAEYKNNLPTGTTKVWHANGQLAKEVTFYGHPQNFDMVTWDDKGKLIEKKLYLPPSPFEGLHEISKDLQKSFDELSEKIQKLKKIKPS